MMTSVEKNMRKLFLIVLFSLFFLPISGIEKAKAVTAAPILVVVNGNYAANQFGNYLAEILRAEGINAFTQIELNSLTLAELQQHSLTILAETSLSVSQATLFTNYVNGGGKIIAMRPDQQIAGLFGLGNMVNTANDRYVKFSTSVVWNGEIPAGGLASSALQTHGTADRYNLAAGAVMIAELYATRTTTDGFPAVVGSANGRAAAFTYDLAKSVVYTRQGNPANANLDVDNDNAIRTIDLFQLSGGGSWVDKELMSIPQADEQQRLFARLVKLMVSGEKPLPQLWYFPNGKKTMLILTSDSHANLTTMYQAVIDSWNARGAKGTFYISIASEPNESSVASWTSQGYTFGLHPYAFYDDPNFPVNNLTEGYNAWDSWFSLQFPSTPKSSTVRNHMIVWEGWTTAAEIAISHNIHMDTDFYVWGTWLQKLGGTWPHGYTTGSGQPMKFIHSNGTVLNNYQQLTQLVDEQLIQGAGNGWEGLSGVDGVAVSRELIDASQAGNYAALMTQFHVDYYFGPAQQWAEGTMEYANSLAIPMWDADKWLNFTMARHDAEFTDVNWDSVARTLSFNLAANGGAQVSLTIMVPHGYAGFGLNSVTVDGSPATFSLQTIKGRSEAFINVTAVNHSIVASYNAAISADLELTKSALSTAPTVGSEQTFTISLTNKGPGQVTGVKAKDILGSGYQYTGSTPSIGSYNPVNGEWTVGTLSVNQSETLQLRGIVLVSGNYNNYAQVIASSLTDPDSTPNDNSTNQDDDDTVLVTPVLIADLELTKVAANLAPYVGDSEVFTVTVTNKGPNPAPNVMVNDGLGTGYQFTSATASQGSYNQANGNWTIGTLSASQSATLRLTSTVKPSGSYANYAQVTASGASDPDSIPNDGSTNQDDDDSVTPAPIPVADLSVMKTVSNNSPFIGSQVIFTISVTNGGPSSATGVTVKDVLPSGYTFVGSSQPANYDSLSGIWTIGTINAAQNVSIQLTATVKITGIYNNRAEVWTSLVFDKDSTPGSGMNEDDDDTAVVTPISTADLSILKQAQVNSPLYVGDNVVFNLTLANAGPNTAGGVVVKDLLPSGYEYISATASQGGYTPQTGLWDAGVLLANTNASLSITARVKPAGIYTNVGEVWQSQVQDPDSVAGNGVTTEDDYGAVTLNPLPLADLSMVKTLLTASPAPGKNVTFSIRIINSGPSSSGTVTIRDVIPAFHTFISSDHTVENDVGVLTWNLGPIQANEEIVISLVLRADLAGSYSNWVQVWTSNVVDPDSTPGNGNESEDDMSGVQYDVKYKVLLPFVQNIP